MCYEMCIILVCKKNCVILRVLWILENVLYWNWSGFAAIICKNCTRCNNCFGSPRCVVMYIACIAEVIVLLLLLLRICPKRTFYV